MKKLLAITLSAVMALSLTACGGESKPAETTAAPAPKDAKTVYQEAVKKNAELKSLDMTSAMEVAIRMGEESVDMSMDMEIKMDQANSDKMVYIANTTTKSQDQTVDMTIFYTDGYYYMDAMGQKIKYAMPLEQMMAQVQNGGENMEADMMKDLTVKEDGDNKIITFTGDPEKMDSYVKDALGEIGGAGQNLEGMEMKINGVSGEYTINKDGYYTNTKIVMDMDMTMQGETANMVITMTNIVNNPGQEVTVTVPSTDGFQEIDMSTAQQAA